MIFQDFDFKEMNFLNKTSCTFGLGGVFEV